jgi:hypothetical protein
MRNDVFIAHLASGAIAASVAGAWMTAQTQTEAPSAPVSVRETVCADLATVPDEATDVAANQAMVVTLKQSLSAWDKKLEREFRGLALAEAKGTLSDVQCHRLEELTRWRNRLLNAQTSEEISLQLKRDRLLARMENVLKEYVEFQEATGQKRASA